MSSSPRSPKRRSKNPFIQILQKGLALLALLNLGLVVFDLTYISARDLYLTNLPALTQVYDPIKGITDHRQTKAYLDQVVLLEGQLANSGPQGETVEGLLTNLRERSEAMIAENPFKEAQKTGTLEKIKNRMRKHRPNDQDSAKQAFRTFWSTDHLTPETWASELAWFKDKITPSITSNYFRPYAENNQLVNHFWTIDLFFIILFGFDFLVRTFFLSHRHKINWLDAMLWHWYDIFLLLPFWRLLRVIPVSIRLHQAQLINLHRVQAHSNRFVAETIVGEVTELVMVRAIGVAQNAVTGGALREWLADPLPTAVTINDVDEVEELINKALAITIQRVLPVIQPDLEALLRHSMVSALDAVPLYQQLQQLPGIGQVPTEVAHQVVEQFTNITTTTLNQVLADEKGREIFNQLSQHFTVAFRQELSDPKTLNQVQTLIADLLEETKLTLLQQLESQDVEQTVDQVHQLRQATQTSALPTIEVL